MVALWRALADAGESSVPGFSDPFARRFLHGGWRLAFHAALAAARHMPSGARERVADAFGVVPLRVAFLDDRLLASMRLAPSQVVLLGAGLDARAWRLAALDGAELFEVDHPATQRFKREEVAAFPLPLARVHWVPVDFEREALAPALAAAGHSSAEPTVWLWEGVVMYLGDQALRATLAGVRERSAPGSALLLHYHEPGATLSGRHLRWSAFRVLGEPQVGARWRATMRGEVERAGFTIDEDVGAAGQAAAVGARLPDNELGRISRVCVARVPKPPIACR
jgi:methyltransferase (TIGR00027 family)